ncbi:MAG: S-layer homology domain-containing protein [bacterium]|nr:S-layer homology domain-containing protein [bacterium]MDE0375620.1 S-layer homology domain-containing protein [bacterium]
MREMPGIFDGTGCDQGLCPREPLRRWEMAVWLVRVLDRANPSAAASSTFADVDAGLWWAPYTERLAQRQVTAGCALNPPRFCPDQTVNRAQMAAFLVRAFNLPAAPAFGFVDTLGNTLQTQIDALAAAGVTAGCGLNPLRYCPGKPVTRAEMATFLARATGIIE